jgi:hypothetical protein
MGGKPERFIAGDEVAFVVERGTEHYEELLAAYDQFRQTAPPNWLFKLLPLTSGPKERIPLQVADSIAYETKKELDRILQDKRWQRRRSLEAVIAGTHHDLIYLDRLQLNEIASAGSALRTSILSLRSPFPKLDPSS